ncbi:MAG: cryptochrome/photolyase family protein [Candidatus Pelagadaptatus aseana]|uniref:cryptochrome/photolyase family protein n=1 Tax=Candidatus Pelagadaptatus aseana TaxID=3120508 RepID=UPI0039B353A1
MKAKRLRLILGDQLNAGHSWFREKDDHTVYLIAELHQESRYVTHHWQKLCAFFASMAAFADALKRAGHRVLHLTLDETNDFNDLDDLLQHYCNELGCEQFEYQRADEYRLACQLAGAAESLSIEVKQVDSEHFLLPFADIEKQFSPQKHHRMESFYRRMRKRLNILMDNGQPVGGQWNYDADNRNAFKANDLKDIPQPLLFANPVADIAQRIKRHGLNYLGEPQDQLLWPINRAQARQLLSFFCEVCLPDFGKFQDAMTGENRDHWSLYHSRLSFALNTKMLHPMEVIETALRQYQAHDQSESQEPSVSLPQIEGFVRQIIGWREYVRGVYWCNMPAYSEQNALNAHRPLPRWFWDGDTNMRCLSHSIGQSLEFAYAHHIQRLMIVGNFALLAGLDPDAVDAWYLGIYIDAIEWVELPNTRGMALFADGGWIATKPYAASGNYINKMSDYCTQCHYKVKLKTGDGACPFNSLYWHFIDRNKHHYERNPRMALPLRQWQKNTPEQRQAVLSQADAVLARLDRL